MVPAYRLLVLGRSVHRMDVALCCGLLDQEDHFGGERAPVDLGERCEHPTYVLRQSERHARFVLHESQYDTPLTPCKEW